MDTEKERYFVIPGADETGDEFARRVAQVDHDAEASWYNQGLDPADRAMTSVEEEAFGDYSKLSSPGREFFVAFSRELATIFPNYRVVTDADGIEITEIHSDSSGGAVEIVYTNEHTDAIRRNRGVPIPAR